MKYLPLFALASTCAFTMSTFAQDHGHLNVGAVGTIQNDQLTFDNAAIFNTAANYVKTLTFATSGTYLGYYQANITLTSLAATPAHLGPISNAPALGSRIFAQLVSVDGPIGGAFAFWETGATTPTISLVCGTTGTNAWQLSENDGSPGSDPYGHIHGRRFTATKPGVYTVGFRAFDFSTNGAGGGPIHTASAVMKMYFQADDNILSVKSDVTSTRITFGARAGFAWQVQAIASLTDAEWTDVGSSVTGDDYLHDLVDGSSVTTNRFYRLQGTPVLP
jgi:hypothetical protein